MSLRNVMEKQRLVMDGAMGTELEAIVPRGSKIQPKSSPLWSGMVLLHEPGLVQRVHESYAEQGAQVLLTLTYQISYASLKKHTAMDDDDIVQLWNLAVLVCRRALGNHHGWVLGSIGPYASYLADGSEYTGYYGNVSKSEIQRYHTPLARYYIESGVDAIAFETIPNFTELKVILNMMLKLLQIRPKSFYTSFNFNGTVLADGTPIKSVVRYINMKLAKHPQLQQNFLGIGMNCLDYSYVEDVIASIDSYPLIIYPNLGFYHDPQSDQYLVDRDPEKWKRLIKQWLSHPNVRIVGGCCLTTPNEIHTIQTLI